MDVAADFYVWRQQANHYVSRKKEIVMLEVTQKIGALDVKVTGESPHEVIEQFSFFGALPAQCPVEGCGHALQLTYKVVGEKRYKYYGMKCANTPAHECNFGQRTDDSSLYYKGAESFGLEFRAREAEESGQDAHEPRQQRRDDFNARDSRPAQNQQQDNGNGEQPSRSGGPTSGQRTLLTNLLTRESVTLNDAYELTRASKKLEEMSVGECARFIDAVKLKLGVK